MATSNLKIYRTKLTPARNALVDNLTGYLDSLTPTYSKSDFQYLKLDKDISIKVNLDQAYVLTSIGNYATITQDNKTWYYFIMDSNWISSSCVELFLSIDSINTFRNDLTMNAKTKIIRQHTEQFGLANNGAATFHPVQDRQMELNKEFYFGAGGTAMSI